MLYETTDRLFTYLPRCLRGWWSPWERQVESASPLLPVGDAALPSILATPGPTRDQLRTDPSLIRICKFYNTREGTKARNINTTVDSTSKNYLTSRIDAKLEITAEAAAASTATFHTRHAGAVLAWSEIGMKWKSRRSFFVERALQTVNIDRQRQNTDLY